MQLIYNRVGNVYSLVGLLTSWVGLLTSFTQSCLATQTHIGHDNVNVLRKGASATGLQHSFNYKQPCT